MKRRDFEIQGLPLSNIVALAKNLNKPISTFDLETTTLMGRQGFGIVECALLTVTPSGQAVAATELVNPEYSVPSVSANIHGLTTAMVKGAPVWGSKWAKVLDRMASEHVVSGYNVKTFDCRAVISQNRRYQTYTKSFSAVLDVMSVYQKLEKSKAKLEIAASCLGVVPKGVPHTALADVVMTVEILEALLAKHGADAVLAHLATDVAQVARAVPPQVQAVADEILIAGYNPGANAKALSLSAEEFLKQVGDAMDLGLLGSNLLDNQAKTQDIAKLLPLTCAKVWGAKSGQLKPLLEAVREKHPTCDYVQLRASLLEAKLYWSRYDPI